MTWLDESAWFLPGEVAGRSSDSLSSLVVTDTAARIWAARNAYLVRLPVAEIVEILDSVVDLWLGPESPWLQAAARRIAADTPYSEAMVRTGLTRLLSGCRKEALLSLLEEELGDPGVLDGFRPRRAVGGSHRACGPALTTHIFSGNVPGLPAISLIQALLAKSASLGKPASEELVFPGMFARSIAAVDAKLAASVAILPWPGGDLAMEQAAFAASEAVVAYGSDLAVESIRARVPPGVRFVGHGHRVSFGVIGRESLDSGALDSLAERAAYDVSLFDQQGCVSAHVLYVERGGGVPPESFAARLANAMAAFERGMPRGEVALEEAAAIQQVRAEVELREIREEPVRQWASPGGTAWTVIYDDDPSFIPSCLNRVVRVKPVTDLGEIPSLVRPFRRYLQTVGAAMSRERRVRLAEALAPLGACRICTIGDMPHPPLTWHHDGGFNLLPLLRWTAIEE
jgi:acyl-CoA reductase LuxC